MVDKVDLNSEAETLGSVPVEARPIRETVITEKLPETPEERTARLKREWWEAVMGHAFRGVAVFVYVAIIALCAHYLSDPKLGEWAQRVVIPLVAALAAFAVGKSTK